MQITDINPIYLIMGGVAIVFVIYFAVLSNIMKKKRVAQVEALKSRMSHAELTEEQKRLLLFGGILSAHRCEKLLSIMPKEDLTIYVYGLREQWDITDEASAKDTIESLLALERSTEYDEIVATPDASIQKMQTKIAKGINVPLEEVQKTKSTYSWDTTRAVSLAKWCFWVGYITENEMWEYIKRVEKIALEKGKSWTDYMVSFLLGRTMQGFDLGDVSAEANRLLNSTWEKDEGEVYKNYSFRK